MSYSVKAVVAAFNQEKALVGAFSVLTNLRMELFQALLVSLLARCRCGVAATLTQPSSDTSFVNVNLMILDSGTNIAASILCAANKLGFIIIGKGSVFSVECQSLCHRGTFILLGGCSGRDTYYLRNGGQRTC